MNKIVKFLHEPGEGEGDGDLVDAEIVAESKTSPEVMLLVRAGTHKDFDTNFFVVSMHPAVDGVYYMMSEYFYITEE